MAQSRILLCGRCGKAFRPIGLGVVCPSCLPLLDPHVPEQPLEPTVPVPGFEIRPLITRTDLSPKASRRNKYAEAKFKQRQHRQLKGLKALIEFLRWGAEGLPSDGGG
jgi:hypothetical protein